MGLRHAQLVAALEKVGARAYSTYLDRVSLQLHLPGRSVQHLNVQMAPGIGIVTGGNGAGKTTLLRGLQALENVSKAAWPARLLQVEARGFTSGADWTVRLDRVEGADPVTVSIVDGELPRLLFVDPAEESQAVRHHFEQDANASDLLEGTDPASFDDSWLDHASRVLRRAYDYIEVFEIEGAEGDNVVPWFRIGSSGVDYDTLSAGRGELSAIYLLWKLSRVESDSIVIIDEPEAWLASFSQTRLKETLAYLSTERGLQFVLTTHSPEMYLGLPEARVTVLESLPNAVAYGPMNSTKAAHSLGAPMRPSLAVLTEDAVAAALVESIVRANDSVLLEAVEIFHAQNGESALAQVQREFIDGTTRQRRLQMQVVLDGDQRITNGGKRSKTDARVYLPGDTAPDETLKRVVTSAISTLTDADLQQQGVTDPVSFRLAIGAAAGSEHHDWFVEVSKGFSSYAAACDVLVRLCLTDEGFARDAEALVSSIVAKLS